MPLLDERKCKCLTPPNSRASCPKPTPKPNPIYFGFTSGPLKTRTAFFPLGNNFFETPERCSASEQEQDLCDPNGDLATKLVGAKQILHS